MSVDHNNTMDDTIFALASGAGRSGVAVFRISGPKVTAILNDFCGIGTPIPRMMTLSRIGNPDSDEEIDRGLVAFFPSPHSFTGEDVAEFHVHGSRAVVRDLTESLGQYSGTRLAEPGEFTRRAFENGRMDLTEVEGLADLIDAETTAQRRQALRQMEGSLGQLYDDWRGQLVRLLAYAEAEIDFPDENLPEGILAAVLPELLALHDAIGLHLDDNRRGERLRDGFRIVLLGAPNVGKSSLLNALARRDIAIVSEEAGTTRDVLEVHLDLGGLPVTFFDTAGLREAQGQIEAEGMRRALKQAETADLRVLLADCRTFPDPGEGVDHLADGDFLVWSKADLVENLELEAPMTGGEVILLSSKTGQGIDDFLHCLQSRVGDDITSGETPVVSRLRHRQGLEETQVHLRRLIDLAASGPDFDVELVAEDLRMAARSLGRLTGRVDVEDLLDVIFRDFCIGK